MGKSAQSLTHKGEAIYTLAQSGTQKTTSTSPKALIKGEGTEISNNPSLANRAKRKTITHKTVLSLIDVAKEKCDTDRIQAYWNTYHCQSKITVSNGRVFGDYCKNRFCTVCAAIRKAEIINKYYPTISQWEEPHFVTLTVKACKAQKLDYWVWGMFRAFHLIRERVKKNHQRS